MPPRGGHLTEHRAPGVFDLCGGRAGRKVTFEKCYVLFPPTFPHWKFQIDGREFGRDFFESESYKSLVGGAFIQIQKHSAEVEDQVFDRFHGPGPVRFFRRTLFAR